MANTKDTPKTWISEVDLKRRSDRDATSITWCTESAYTTRDSKTTFDLHGEVLSISGSGNRHPGLLLDTEILHPRTHSDFQPFLKPVPPLGSDVLASIVRPFGYLVGAVRTLLVVVLALVYLLLVEGACLLLIPVPPLYRIVTHVFTAILCRLVLLLVGLWWIPVEMVTRKRGRGPKFHEKWNPGAGDIIVSNWASWLEILWLAIRFDPIFVLPVCSSINMPSQQASSPITRTPGRRTGTGSAALSTPAARTPTPARP
ncbi:hypothetical protein A0H81_04005 [Grifola frondosa]|uniref:Uncharacterized protein n=1 Tax=Grifola frondosa TaxID=5627 RepID=A0A1C7MIS9_GRIFR|nr:hypothetical protein A0H81_04005 [Grifola frondosa]